jgi:polynucleotide 5'-hydroxyl-kinase GRC3/NOL9
MLSAFQARKARLQPQSNASGDRNSTPHSTSGSDTSFSEAKPILIKRNPSQRDGVQDNSRQHKKKKTHDATKTTRYFDAGNGFQVQESFVAIDQDEDISMSELDEDRIAREADISLRTKIRAWSPSQPIPHSSEDDSEDSTTHPEMDESRPMLQDKSIVLSSFIPQENVNTFQLSVEEIHGMLDGRSTVLLIPVSQSIAFIGVYSLTILKGSISVCGLQMGPSKTAHRIFAPRSSPIPVLETIASIARSDDLLDVLPQRIKNVVADYHVVLLLQELRTGIEGLGRVIRTFEHVFRPSPLQMTPLVHTLGIPGVYPVRFR